MMNMLFAIRVVEGRCEFAKVPAEFGGTAE